MLVSVHVTRSPGIQVAILPGKAARTQTISLTHVSSRNLCAMPGRLRFYIRYIALFEIHASSEYRFEACFTRC